MFIRLVLLRGVFVCGVLGVWIVGFQMGWFARLPLSFSFLDVVMLFIGRMVLLDDIVFVCLSVGISDVFVCFFRWFDGLRSIDLMCRCIMRKKSKLMFANVRLFHRWRMSVSKVDSFSSLCVV